MQASCLVVKQRFQIARLGLLEQDTLTSVSTGVMILRKMKLLFNHDRKIVDWDVKPYNKRNKLS